jgi:hypothetical protein
MTAAKGGAIYGEDEGNNGEEYDFLVPRCQRFV